MTRGYEDPPTPQFRYDGEPAIGIGVSMSKGGNILELGVALETAIARIEATCRMASTCIASRISRRSSRSRSGSSPAALFEAIGIVLIVSLLSLGVRAGLVVAVSIPLVLAITFVFMQSFGISLQRISLGALVISLGLLVDDAMIAVEMMVKKMEEGWDKFRAATFAYTSTAFPDAHGDAGVRGGISACWICEERRGRILLHAVRGGDHRAAGVMGGGRDLHAVHRRRVAQGAASVNSSARRRRDDGAVSWRADRSRWRTAAGVAGTAAVRRLP